MTDLSTDEFDSFRDAIGDVRPTKSSAKVTLQAGGSAAARFNQLQRQKAATSEALSDSNDLSGDFVDQLDPHAILDFKRPGVQNGVYRNLRLGKYGIEARLDLHHHTVDQARSALFRFVKDCLVHDIRCALITHGKGEMRQEPAKIKSCVAHWLPQLDEVLAFHSAQKHHGGTGATYIMLRKSERKRLDNLERHQKRRL